MKDLWDGWWDSWSVEELRDAINSYDAKHRAETRRRNRNGEP